MLQAPGCRALQPRWPSPSCHRAAPGGTQAALSWVFQAGVASLRERAAVRARAAETHGGLSGSEDSSGGGRLPASCPVSPGGRGGGGASRAPTCPAPRHPRSPPRGQGRGTGGTHITAGVLEAAAAVIFHRKRLYWRRPRDGSTDGASVRAPASARSLGTRAHVQAAGQPAPRGRARGDFTVRAAPPHYLLPPCTGGCWAGGRGHGRPHTRLAGPWR